MNRDEAFTVILEAHRDFVPRWNEHLEFWEGEDPGITNDFSTYAHYVVDLVKHDQTTELDMALDIIEQLLVNGDESVQYGVKMGFLEAVTNILLSWEREFSLRFASKLHPTSKEFYRKLDTFWGTSIPGMTNTT